jgi:DNA-binding beta-propeller fold protein YncE
MRTRKTLLAIVCAVALVAVSSLPAAAKSASWTIVSTITLPSVVGLALSPDGNTLYAASPTDSTIRVVDTHTFKQTGPISVSVTASGSSGTGAPFEIALTLDGSKLFVGNTSDATPTSGTVVVVDTQSRKIVGSVNVPGLPRSLSADRDYASAMWAGVSGSTCNVLAIDTTTLSTSSQTPLSAKPCDAAWVEGFLPAVIFVADLVGNRIETFGLSTTLPTQQPTWIDFRARNGGFSGSTLYWADNGSGGEFNSLNNFQDGAKPSAAVHIAVGPVAHAVLKQDESIAYITNFQPKGEVAVVDLSAKRVVDRIPVGKNPNDIVLSPTEDRLYVANQGEGTISAIELNNDAGTPSTPTAAASPSPSATAIAPLSSHGTDPLVFIVIALIVLLLVVVTVVMIVLIRRGRPPATPLG